MSARRAGNGTGWHQKRPLGTITMVVGRVTGTIVLTEFIKAAAAHGIPY